MSAEPGQLQFAGDRISVSQLALDGSPDTMVGDEAEAQWQAMKAVGEATLKTGLKDEVGSEAEHGTEAVREATRDAAERFAKEFVDRRWSGPDMMEAVQAARVCRYKTPDEGGTEAVPPERHRFCAASSKLAYELGPKLHARLAPGMEAAMERYQEQIGSVKIDGPGLDFAFQKELTLGGDRSVVTPPARTNISGTEARQTRSQSQAR